MQQQQQKKEEEEEEEHKLCYFEYYDALTFFVFLGGNLE